VIYLYLEGVSQRLGRISIWRRKPLLETVAQ
jgi:hypothetical protein